MESGPKEWDRYEEEVPKRSPEAAIEVLDERRIEIAKESHPASIRLEFFRHDNKSKNPPPGGNDNKVRLTPEGRISARAKGKNSGLNPEMAVIYGSPKERTLETAYQRLFADQPEISSDMTLEEIVDKVSRHIRYGTKHAITHKLDNTYNGSIEMEQALKKHYTKEKDFTKFMREESDSVASMAEDKTSDTFSRNAAKIAEIIKKYLHAFPSWEKTAATSDKKDQYAENGNQLQRLFSSHQAALEPFIIRLLELNGGINYARRYIENMPDGNGFGFSDGYKVIISRSKSGTPTIHITHQNLKFEITEILLDKIIAARR